MDHPLWGLDRLLQHTQGVLAGFFLCGGAHRAPAAEPAPEAYGILFNLKPLNAAGVLGTLVQLLYAHPVTHAPCPYDNYHGGIGECPYCAQALRSSLQGQFLQFVGWPQYRNAPRKILRQRGMAAGNAAG